MAKLLFIENTVDRSKFYKGGSDADVALYVPSSVMDRYSVVTVSDSDYNAWLNGNKNWDVNNGNVVFSDYTELANSTETITSEQSFKDYLNIYVRDLEQIQKDHPNHSKSTSMTAAINFVNSIDYNSLSFPSVSPEKYLYDNGVYLNIAAL